MRLFNVARWILLTTLGLAGGLAAGAAIGIPLGRMLNAMIVAALFTAVAGGVLGTFQAAALRPLLAKPSWWIVATTLGVGFGMAFGVVTVQQTAIRLTGSPLRIAESGAAMRALVFVAVGLIAGTVLGVAQWLVLRAQRSSVRQWAVTCGAALALAFCLASLLVDAAGVTYASALGRCSFLILSGVLFGGMTSWPLRRAA